nr:NAD(P)-dependent oxidoreductase [uncultured Anaerosporobacter sp.]
MNQIIYEDIVDICNEKLPWEKLWNMRLMVTGANGFIGSYIIYTLLELNRIKNANITIFALCRDRKRTEEKFADYLNEKKLVFIYQDICEEIDDLYKSDIILHAASPNTPYLIQKEPYRVFEANVMGYQNILKKSICWGTSDILFFSSSAVYGYSTPSEGADETYRSTIDFTNAKDVYALSKQQCEMMTVSVKNQLTCKIKTIRPFVIYGPGEGFSKNKAMTDFVKNYIDEENIVMKSKGEVIRSYLYIKDAVKAIFYVLLLGSDDVYNIASRKNICDIKKLASVFCDLNTKLNIEYKIKNQEYLNSQWNILIGKTDKIEALGWKEETLLEEGVSRMVRWAKDSDFDKI